MAPAFDPYPFQLLCMLVSLEGVLLSTFVLIKQNRMSNRADRRAHLDLQMNLLTEKEVTKVIQLLERISDHLGLTDHGDAETRELGQETAVDELARELDQRLPGRPSGVPKKLVQGYRARLGHGQRGLAIDLVGRRRSARRYTFARSIRCRIAGVNRAVASPRKRLASARQRETSPLSGHASACKS